MRYLDDAIEDSPEGVLAWLLSRCENAAELATRTSFLTAAGVQAIRDPLQTLLDRGGQFCAVLGGTSEQTEHRALAQLAAITANYPEQASLYLATPPSGIQNAKTYYSKDPDGRAYAYVGSANLTNGGLASNYEAGFLLDSHTDGKELLDSIHDGILAWTHGSKAVPVTPEVVDAFGEREWLTGLTRAQIPASMRPSPSIAEYLPGTLDRMEALATNNGEPAGIPTGFAELDSLLGGLHAGTFTVIGGRPGVGKTNLLLNFARAAATRKHPTAIVTLEMTPEDVTQRLVSATARIPHWHIGAGLMTDDEWTRMASSMAKIAEAPLFVNSAGYVSTSTLRREAARLVAEEGVRLILVDYLQLVSPSTRFDTREQQVGDVARELKAIALELDVAMVVTSQLNRTVELRTDKMPRLEDLHESDTIGQVADVVILLYREDLFERESPRAGEADFIIAKNRNGPTGAMIVAFQGHYCRFVDMAPS